VAAVLEFEGITKEYRRLFRGDSVEALADFSLAVEPGEILGFLGPNGAGKTTAIHIALGLMLPGRGRGTLLGQPFGHARTRRRVGFLPENVALYHRPAAELLRFYGALNAVSEPQLSRQTRELLAQLELSQVAGRNAAKLSRGMLQRVGLAQALINDPELLLLDEPTSALDPAARVRVRALLLAAREAGKTIFLSSHLLSEVELICDRIAILRRGRLARLGKTSQLMESEERFEVAARGIAAADFPGAVSSNGVLKLEVPAAAQRATIERMWAAGGEIVSVNRVRKSLEEVFLELTGEGN